MEYHDMRGKPLEYIQQHINRFHPAYYHESSVSYTTRETPQEDIEKAYNRAMNDNADMIIVQEYGIAWYIPNIQV